MRLTLTFSHVVVLVRDALSLIFTSYLDFGSPLPRKPTSLSRPDALISYLSLRVLIPLTAITRAVSFPTLNDKLRTLRSLSCLLAAPWPASDSKYSTQSPAALMTLSQWQTACMRVVP